MYDFSSADEQKNGFEVIPSDSIVKVKLTVRYPENDRGTDIPEITQSKNSSLQYMACELEVIEGRFTGVKIYQNFFVTGAETTGQEKAISIAKSRLRAILEAARGVSPKDISSEAIAKRKVQSYADFGSLIFPIKVGVETATSLYGEAYLHNSLQKIITPDLPEYGKVMSGQEIISDKPLPEVKSKMQAAPKNNWGLPQTSNLNSTVQTAPPSEAGWGRVQAPPQAQTRPASQQAQLVPPPVGYCHDGVPF